MAQKAKEKVLSLVLAELSKSQLHNEDTEMNSSQSEDTSTTGLSFMEYNPCRLRQIRKEYRFMSKSDRISS